MRVFYASDLHIEFEENQAMRLAEGAYDLAILAGDIGVGTAGLKWAAERFDVPIIYVMGNHEYYHHEFHALQDECRSLADSLGIHWLEREVIDINGLRIAGCTLWTDYAVNGTRERSQRIAQSVMPDHKCIQFGNDATYSPQDAAREHDKAVAWLAEQKDVDVVVTHHCPSLAGIGHRHPQNEYTPGFISELDGLIEQVGAQAWVFGHHHCAVSVVHDSGTRLLSNQHGYPEECREELGWNTEACLEVSPR